MSRSRSIARQQQRKINTVNHDKLHLRRMAESGHALRFIESRLSEFALVAILQNPGAGSDEGLGHAQRVQSARFEQRRVDNRIETRERIHCSHRSKNADARPNASFKVSSRAKPWFSSG